MAKFYGAIGCVENRETAPGVWRDVAVEKNYSGDVIKNTRHWQGAEQVNEGLTLNNVISIVADLFAEQHFHAFRYVKWMGACWKITSVETQRPRLLLTIGGVYNGETAGSP